MRKRTNRKTFGPNDGRNRRPRGFSLIEVMFVVVLVGVLAMLAVPSMARARLDRRAYEGAGNIAQLFRDARTRAIGRGAAVLVHLSTAGTRGTYRMYEAVAQDPSGSGFNTPRGTCRTPMTWVPLAATNANVRLLESVALDTGIDEQADVQTRIVSPGGTTPAQAFVCFTPLGRAYFVEGTPVFDGALPMEGALEVTVTRSEGGNPVGLARRVVVPPSGVARVHSTAL